MNNITRAEMVKERNLILKNYKRDCYISHEKLVDEVVCEGHGIFVNTGKMVKRWVTEYVMTMEEWNADQARRYNELNEAIEAIDAPKKLSAKAKRYRAELEEIKARAEYLENWLNENAVNE